MNRLFLIASLMIPLQISCSSGGGGTTATTVFGTVTSPAGATVTDATVTLGSTSTTTDSSGSYTLTANAGNGQVIRFSKSGYVTSTRFVDVFTGVQSYLPLIMTEMILASTLNADTGGTVSGTRNSSLTAGTGAFVDSSGNTVTGSVDVYLTPYDPNTALEVNAFPGELRGVDTNGDTVPLKSYGILDVTVLQNGNELQIKDGSTISLKMPASTAGSNPDDMRVWTLDTTTGLWNENTNAATYDEATNTYSTDITHLSPCNLDWPYDPSCVFGVVVDENGNPISGASVQIDGTGSYTGQYSSDVTDSNGGFCMTVERSQPAIITITTPDGTVTTRQITANATLSSNYPADCETSSCKMVRSVESGTPDPGESTSEADCEVTAANNPFSGTCAYDLGNFFACFSPSGACTYDFNWLTFNFTTEFANGSSMEFDMMQVTGNAANFYGPTGLLCGSMTFENNIYAFNTPNGTVVEISTDSNGSMTMTCDGTTTVTMNGSQMDALSGCIGTASEEEVGVYCTPAEGSFGSSCTTDVQCDSTAGNTCCGRAPIPKKCLSSAFCTFYDQYSCETNDDCLIFGNYACCYYGFYNACFLSETCMPPPTPNQ